jgi:hypothetical protein
MGKVVCINTSSVRLSVTRKKFTYGAYALIRAQGTAIGKMDFIGGLKLHPVM